MWFGSCEKTVVCGSDVKPQPFDLDAREHMAAIFDIKTTRCPRDELNSLSTSSLRETSTAVFLTFYGTCMHTNDEHLRLSVSLVLSICAFCLLTSSYWSITIEHSQRRSVVYNVVMCRCQPFLAAFPSSLEVDHVIDNTSPWFSAGVIQTFRILPVPVQFHRCINLQMSLLHFCDAELLLSVTLVNDFC